MTIIRSAFHLAITVAAPLIAFSATARADGGTIRIEPRAFYGATVTLEEGVRVFRPLPVDRYVIINPNNTPIQLSISDTHVVEQQFVNATETVVGDGPRVIGGGLFVGSFPDVRHGGDRGRFHGRFHGDGHGGHPGGMPRGFGRH